MPFNFPDPAVSTTATNPVTGASYQWKADPGKWVLTGGPAVSTPSVVIQLLPPDNPQTGDLWIHSETLIEYAWDGTQWFEVGSSCGGGASEEEEEQEQYHPFVNSFKLVAPDDFNGAAGTATILTDAYDAGDDSYLSPTVKSVRFADIDLNDRKLESAVVGDTIELTPDNESENGTNTLYGALEVTAVNSSADGVTYDVDFDTNRSVIYTEGDIVHYRIAPRDIYVKKTGDTMTGALVMNAAQGILMRDSKLDFVRTGESLKDSNGDPVLDSNGAEQWDSANERFSHIESVAPILLKSDDSFSTDLSAPFGIRVEIDDGNTHRNRFVVGNRHGDAVSITGGTGPNVQFGKGFEGNQNPPNGRIDWEDGEEGGVKITGIPTPTNENPDSSLAVNKRYVDGRDEILQREVEILQEEIEAIAPTTDKGIWQDGASATPGMGHFAMRVQGGAITQNYEDSNIVQIIISTTAKDGSAHSFLTEQVGDLIQLFDVDDKNYALFEITAIDTTSSTEYVNFEVTWVQGLGETNVEDDVLVKTFAPPTGGTSSEFVLKAGDHLTGTLAWNQKAGDTENPYVGIKILENSKRGSKIILWAESGGSFNDGQLTTELVPTKDTSVTNKKFVDGLWDFSQYPELT